MIKPLLYALLLAAGTATAAPKPLENGTPAPAFDLPVFGDSHRHMSLADLRGKVVLLDFWASWCGPCRQSFPLYEKMRRELPAKEFAILAINLDEMSDGPTAFLEEHPVGYTSLADPAGEVARQFGLIGMPSSFIIDRDGVVRGHHTGFRAQEIETVRAELQELIAATGDARGAEATAAADETATHGSNGTETIVVRPNLPAASIVVKPNPAEAKARTADSAKNADNGGDHDRQ